MEKFLFIFGQFLEFDWSGGTWILKNVRTSFSLFFYWSFIHQSLLVSCHGNPVFTDLEKLKKWYTF